MSSTKTVTNRLNSFRRHCDEKGIELLRDDIAFIDRSLNAFDRSDFKTVLQRYLFEWQKGMVKEESGTGGQGEGRRRANLWLLGVSNEKLQKKDIDMVF